jgi:tartrate-resistant acid phosphatase type 5
MISHLVPIFERSGVKAVFSGHEHNFQYSRVAGINYFITGAGGKVRLAPPSHFAAAQTTCWAASGHFVIVEVTADQMVVTPMATLGATAELAELMTFDPAGSPVAMPIVINRE